MTQLQSEKQKQRRRGILKAVASAPVVFTLPTGAAVAAASLSCKDKSLDLATTTANPPLGATMARDKWIRFSVPRKRIQITRNNGNVDTIANAFTLNNEWYRVNNGVVTNISTKFYKDFPPEDQGGKYYLLVDQSDYPGSGPQSYVYLGTENTVASPIAGNSCWNSITPGGNAPSSNVLN